MKPGRKKGCTNSPDHRAAISDGHAEKRGFTDQEVLDYVEAGHSIREAAEIADDGGDEAKLAERAGSLDILTRTYLSVITARIGVVV